MCTRYQKGGLFVPLHPWTGPKIPILNRVNVILEISVVSVVNAEIICNAVLEISVLSVVDDEIIFNVALQISVINVVDEEIIFNEVL